MSAALLRRAVLAATLSLAAAASAQAPVRIAPHDVQVGRAVVDGASTLRVDGAEHALAPGARVHLAARGASTPRTALAEELPVLFRRDASGAVHELWLLTEADYERLSRTRGREDLDKAIAQILNERIAR
ncbi:hypothetical protein WG922_08170 [Ramlibacter sp. AN1015]|uniref:hypothetical protein n=1 Tax=Ramlibacter sp. AN1015 TaxID=3133428 RepID=UPI0030BED74D